MFILAIILVCMAVLMPSHTYHMSQKEKCHHSGFNNFHLYYMWQPWLAKVCTSVFFLLTVIRFKTPIVELRLLNGGGEGLVLEKHVF